MEFPAVVTIKRGDTIVWKQMDDVEHTVTSASAEQRYDSGVLKQGKSFQFTFNVPGTYYYKCSLHPIMRGKIVVE